MARMLSRYFSTPAAKDSVRFDIPHFPLGSNVLDKPSASLKLIWICTPFPTLEGSRIGAKVASSPKCLAVERTISRTITAASAARIPSSGPITTSYCSGPYSFMMLSDRRPAASICVIIASHSSLWLSKPARPNPSPKRPLDDLS